MADPTVATNANGEWFELTALAPVDLNNLKIHNKANPDPATIAGLKPALVSGDCLAVAPGDFILFAHQADPGVNGGLPAINHIFGASLTNTRTAASRSPSPTPSCTPSAGPSPRRPASRPCSTPTAPSTR